MAHQGDYRGNNREGWQGGRNYGWNAGGYNTQPYYGGGGNYGGDYIGSGPYEGRDNYDPGYGSSYGGGQARPYYGADRSPDYSGRMSQGNFGGSGNYGMGSESSGRTQNHTGRGPRNYQRSDERIRDDVNEELTRHPGIDASEIDVRVDNGEVTLTGTVDDRRAKRMAEDVAESCSGVKDVHNQLHIDQAQSQAQSRSSRDTQHDREVPRHTERESAASGSHQASGTNDHATNNATDSSRGKSGNKAASSSSTSAS